MTDRKLIAVVGATGAQGGGLARAILDDGEGPFALRALTRNPLSDAAVRLADRRADVVTANLDDVDSLTRAFTGCHGAFGLTNFWEHFSPDTETAQATNLAEAAKRAGVSHFIWSTFEDTRKHVPLEDERMPTLLERFKVPHFDAKGQADEAFRKRGVPTTFLLTSFYWENFIHFGVEPKRDADGVLTLTLPLGDKKLPGIGVEDIGRCAYGIFKTGSEMTGRTVGVAGEHLTGAEMATALSEALGEEVRYNAVPPDVYRSFGFPGADEMGNMFQFKADFEELYCGNRSLEESRRLNPRLKDFRRWLQENGDRIPVDAKASG